MDGSLTRFVAYLIANMVAVLVIGTISRRWIDYDNLVAILIFALLLGLFNFFIKPALQLLTLPLTCLTFGLFAIVLNALLFVVAANLTPGIEVRFFWGGIFGAIIASVASGIIYSAIDEREGERP
jgi:putative membrane protein